MQQREAIVAPGMAPLAGAPYTPAVLAGDLLFISGQLGLDPETKKPYDDFERQVEGCIAGIRALVEHAGGTLADVVKTTVLMQDLAQFGAMNAIYGKHFDGAIRPARSTYQVAALPAGAQVEIEAIAQITPR
jgi:2-iminobutanoate/2-iminopropanoate deaminase